MVTALSSLCVGPVFLLGRFPIDEVNLNYYLDFDHFTFGDYFLWDFVQQRLTIYLNLGLARLRGRFRFENNRSEVYELALNVTTWREFGGDFFLEGGGQFIRGFYSEFFFQRLYHRKYYQFISYVVEGRALPVYYNVQACLYEGFLVNSV